MPPTVEGIGLLFLLPFCSHNTPKQGGTRRRTAHHQTTCNRLLPNAFRARSEGYRSWPSCTHNPKVAGSNPAPATIDDEGLADAAAANPFRLPRLHPGIGQRATTQHAGELRIALRIAAERVSSRLSPATVTRADLVIE